MTRTQTFLLLIERKRRWLLLAQLATLHLVLMQDIAQPFARTLLVVHIGLFMLWQPLVRAERRLGWAGLLAVLGAISFMAAWANAWLMIGWVMLLAGIVGGKVFFSDSRAMRMFYLLALAYLVLALLLLLAPKIIPRPFPLPDPIELLVRFGLPAMFAAMMLLPMRGDEAEHAEVIDFVYSSFVFLLLAVLVLGTLALMLLTDRGYVEALAVTVTAIAAVLLFLAWAWNPRAGFSGLGLVFSRYVLSVGLPFEDWMRDLTELAARESDPDSFVEQACRSFGRLAGVSGVRWQTETRESQFGKDAGHGFPFHHGALAVTLYAPHHPGPALVWHVHLLVQVLGEFHLAKLRSRQVQQLSYLQAVHETGARLTHDVKNLLQSLNALVFAAEREGDEVSPQFRALLRRQLPVISQRLQQTLEKLKQPAPELQSESEASRWWREVQRRCVQPNVRLFAIGLRDGVRVPAGLFDSALENLLENALRKQAQTPDLAVSVSFDLSQGVALSVCDTGAPIPAAIARDLFHAPVPSEAGLGIGLYQVARQAEWHGYRLSVAANDPGQVCVKLERRADAGVVSDSSVPSAGGQAAG
jgi:signal transduction histidine kinase